MNGPIRYPAEKGGAWTWLWRRWVGYAFRRRFAALHLDGPRDLGPLPDRPTVFFANHCGWWDGFVARLVMEEILGYDGYVPMEEKNLRRFPTLRHLGAFGLDRGDGRQAVAALRYAEGVLRAAPGRALWIFPQGVLLPQDQRPLVLEGGAAWVAHHLGARLVPVAVRYEMRDLERPEVFVRLGGGMEVDPAGRAATTAAMTTRLTALVDGLRDDVAGDRVPRDRPALRGGGGVDQVWERVKGLLAAPGGR